MAARRGALPAPTTTDAHQVRRTVLPGGLRVVSEQVPGVRSVAFGIWVAVGSRDERASQHGCSHFLEHLLFKGTARRSALEISSIMDAVGAEMNAFTAEEHTCYYARVLDSDLPLAVDVVVDLLTSSLVTGADVEVERGVILEEIAMREDDPDDVVQDAFLQALYGDSPLGRPIVGTVDSIEALSRAQVVGFYRKRYDLPHMVVTASGAVDHDVLLRLVRDAFGPLLTGDAEPAAPRGVSRPVRTHSRVVVERRPTEQAHLVLGTTALAADDPRRFALQVLSGALGEGMSSRLFQAVREQRGLAYSVYSYAMSYADTGVFGVYAGCQPAKVGEVLELIRAELAAAADGAVTDEEVRRAKGPLRASMVLDLEDTGSRMQRLGRGELFYGGQLSIDEVLARIEAVTPEDVRAVAADVLRRPFALGAVGPFDEADLAGVLQ